MQGDPQSSRRIYTLETVEPETVEPLDPLAN
jgi:hypothetical protein